MPFQINGKRNYKAEDKWDANHKNRKEQRAERMVARRAAVASGIISKHSPKQIDHIKPLSKGGSNKPSNTRAISAHANESYRRNANGSIKGKRG